MAQVGRGEGEVLPQRPDIARPAVEAAALGERAARPVALRGRELGADPHAPDDPVREVRQGRIRREALRGPGDGMFEPAQIEVGIVADRPGDGHQERPQAPQEQLGQRPALRPRPAVDQFADRDQGGKDLLGALQAQQGLAGAVRDALPGAGEVEDHGPGGLDAGAHAPPVVAGVPVEGLRVGLRQGDEPLEVAAEPREAAPDLRHRPVGRPVGMQPPDDERQERRPEPARREHHDGGGGLLRGERPVEGDAQHDHQHVAGGLRLHAPDPGIGAGEDQRAGHGHDHGEPVGLQQAEPGPEQPAQDREGRQHAQPRPHRPAIVAEAGEVGGERHGEQGRPLHPDVDQDDDAEREGGAHALHEPHIPKIEAGRQAPQVRAGPAQAAPPGGGPAPGPVGQRFRGARRGQPRSPDGGAAPRHEPRPGLTGSAGSRNPARRSSAGRGATRALDPQAGPWLLGPPGLQTP
jgi:hypothetical protein